MAVGWSGADPVEDSDTADYELAVEMVANVDVTLTHVRVFGTPTAVNQANRKGRIWDTGSGAVLATATMPTILTAGWNSYALASPLTRTAGQRWLVSFTTNGHYGFIAAALNATITSNDGAVSFLSNATSTAGNGRINSLPETYPQTATAGIFWGVDVQYDIGIGGNTRPVISSLDLTTPGDGYSVTATINATDAETLVGATYSIDWGDGSTSGSASASHTYATSGLKAVLGSVTDAGALSAYAARAISLVVPSAGGLDIDAVYAGLISHLQNLGVFSLVNDFEPKAAPLNGPHAALWLESFAPARGRSGLQSTTMRLAFNLRISMNMISEPQSGTDPLVLTATALAIREFSGDFDLNGSISHVDLLGAYGDPLQGRAGYLDQDGKKYRVMVVTIPLIINDVFDQAP